MIGAPGSIELPRRAHPQPSQHIVAGGDCGACALGGALEISIERVYDELKSERQSIEHGEMMRVLRVAQSLGLADRFIDTSPEWRTVSSYAFAAFGRPAYLEHIAWFNYVRMAIDAGYYGLAQVDFQRTGGQARGGPDHWVLICGARTEGSVVGKKITGDVLVSCSARGGSLEWVESMAFLRERGGYNLLLVRPS